MTIKFRQLNGLPVELRSDFRFPTLLHRTPARLADDDHPFRRREEAAREVVRRLAEQADQALDLGDFWREALPEALRTVLEIHADGPAAVAAIAFLQARGFTMLDAEGVEVGTSDDDGGGS